MHHSNFEHMENGNNARTQTTKSAEKIKHAVAMNNFNGRKVGPEMAQLKAQRQKKYEHSKITETPQNFEITTTEEFIEHKTQKLERRQKKEHDKQGYAQRKQKVIVSLEEQTDEQLKRIARKKICECGYRYNVYERGTNIFSCNHRSSKPLGSIGHNPCRNCGNTENWKAVAQCGCEYILCRRCCFSTYNNPKNFKQWYDTHKPTFRITTEAPIESRPVTEKLSYAAAAAGDKPEDEYHPDRALTQLKKYTPKKKRREFLTEVMKNGSPIIESTEQGGAISSTFSGASHTVGGAMTGLKEQIKGIVNSILVQSREFKTKLGEARTTMQMGVRVCDFIDLISDIANIILDYMTSSPLFFDLIELLISLVNKEKRSILKFARSAMTIRIAEDQARKIILEDLKRFGRHEIDFRTMQIRAGQKEYGCLSTMFAARFTNRSHPQYTEVKVAINKLGLFGESEQCGMLEGVSGFCKTLQDLLPHRGAEAFKMFSELARTILPIITVANGLTRLSTEIWKTVKNIVAKFCDSWMTPEQWLEAELYRPDSPIHKLYTTYLTYRKTTSTKKEPGADRKSVV